MAALRWISGDQHLLAVATFIILAVGAICAHRYAFRPSFRRRRLMTENEIEFHRRIVSALPEFEIWPQIPIFALIEPKSRQSSIRWRRGLRLISNRRVDWVIAQHGKPILIIELDDKTHNPKSDKKRDQILGSCDFPVIRYKSRSKASADQIRLDVMQAI